MSMIPNMYEVLVAGLTGLVCHHTLFIHGEWHLWATNLLGLHVTAFLILSLLEARFHSLSPWAAVRASSILCTTYAVTLFASIAIYRLFFHRLRNFPGPPLARLTKFWHVYQCADSKNHLLMGRLHEQYGDFVRTGPSEIMIVTPDAMSAVSELNDKVITRPAWYDNLRPYIGLTTIRGRKKHEQRRRIWDYGFTTKALQSYEPAIQAHARELAQLIDQEAGKPVVVNDCLSWFAFDVMGQVAFSRPIGMLRNQEWHYAVEMMHAGMALLGPFTPVPWLVRIGNDLKLSRELDRMTSWCVKQMDERVKVSTSQPDVSQYLIQWSRDNDLLVIDKPHLHGDAISMIVAGSDTVALTLIFVFYRLAKHPDCLQELQSELDTLENLDDMRTLQSLPCLNGIISETLRLNPGVPTGGLRETPAEGAIICGRFIPGNTILCTPRYTIARLESCFEKANEFIPARWYSRPEMIKIKKAYAPFGLGHYGCIGRNLAYRELRYVTALLASRYNIEFAPGEDGGKVEGNMADQFTACPGKLKLVFTKREEKKVQVEEKA